VVQLMRKTSVYLPDHLKRALGARARATRRSEAEVVRAAVETEVAATSHPTPGAAAAGLDQPVPGRLVGVGVGPGDPDLLTLRAVTALRRADRVLAPSTATDAVGRAETIVRQAAPDVRVERAPFAMHPDPAVRADAMQAIAATVAGYLDAGDEVAFITIGDPLTYSTFSALADAVLQRRAGTTVDVVPGIMAFQSLAARTRTTLVDERQRLSVRTAVGDGDVAEVLAGDLHDPTCTVVVYKGGRHLPQLAEVARAAGRSEGAVAGELLGMSGERIGDLSTLATGPAGYLATVIFPATEGAVRPARSRSGADRASGNSGGDKAPGVPAPARGSDRPSADASGLTGEPAPTGPPPRGDVRTSTGRGQLTEADTIGNGQTRTDPGNRTEAAARRPGDRYTDVSDSAGRGQVTEAGMTGIGQSTTDPGSGAEATARRHGDRRTGIRGSAGSGQGFEAGTAGGGAPT
jgi:precorrin-2/cobalt-factor-2 C20-methyltransferase